MEGATEQSPGSKLSAIAFSSFLVREANNEWRRMDVLLECVAPFLRKNRDLNKPMRSLALLGVFGWLVAPFVDGLSPPRAFARTGPPSPASPTSSIVGTASSTADRSI